MKAKYWFKDDENIIYYIDFLNEEELGIEESEIGENQWNENYQLV